MGGQGWRLPRLYVSPDTSAAQVVLRFRRFRKLSGHAEDRMELVRPPRSGLTPVLLGKRCRL